MKKIKLSVLSLAVCTNLLMAGGDLFTVTPYEVEDVQAAKIVPVTPIVVPTVAPAVLTPVVTPAVVTPVITPSADVSPFYVGLGLAATRYNTNCECTSEKSGVDKTGGLLLRAGYDFNKYMGLEARGLISSLKADGGKVKHFGAFVKPMYPVSNALNIYGLGGIAKTTTTGRLRKTDVMGLAFGAGLEYDLSDDKKKNAKYDREFDGKADQEKGFGVFADYERLYYKSGSPDLDAVSVGLTYDF